MAERSATARSELRCMWGLFSILNSCQGQASPRLITNGRPVKTNVIDYSRKLDQLASFDEECRKIQTEATLASNRVDNSEKRERNFISDEMYIKKHKNKQIMVKGSEKDSPLVVNTARKKSLKAYQSSLLSSSQKCDEKIMKQAQVSVRALIHQNFVDAIFIRKDGTSNESKPFSDALQVLSTNKDLLMKQPNSQCSTRKSCRKSSVEEIKKKSKHTLGDEYSYGSSISDSACLTETVRKKIDLSSARLLKKQEFDVAVEAKRHLSARLKSLKNRTSTVTSKRSPKTLGTILSSAELDFWLLSPMRDSRNCSDSSRMRFCPYSSSPSPNGSQMNRLSPLRTNKEVTLCDEFREYYDDTIDNLSTEMNCSQNQSTDEEAQVINISETGNMKSNGELNTVETNVTNTIQRSKTITSHDENGRVMNPISDLVSENETFTSTVDDTSINELNMNETIKHQEEHQSPVSVLDQFFTEDANNSPSNVMLQTDRKRLQPRRLQFEECSFESSLEDQPISENPYIDEQDYISHFVNLFLKASRLNWDQLSKIRPGSEQLICSSLFDEVEFEPSHYHFHPKLLFDHINEVLLKIHQSHFCSSPWPPFVKPENSPVPLEEIVLDEIMRKADFYLLPWTEERTLDELVANDVAEYSRSWVDFRPEGEHIMVHIAEGILKEFVNDIILGFHS